MGLIRLADNRSRLHLLLFPLFSFIDFFFVIFSTQKVLGVQRGFPFGKLAGRLTLNVAKNVPIPPLLAPCHASSLLRRELNKDSPSLSQSFGVIKKTSLLQVYTQRALRDLILSSFANMRGNTRK